MFADALVNGIVIGSLYAMISLGPSLIYGIMRILDVANVVGLVLGAYVALTLFDATHSLLLALPVAVCASAALGVLLNAYVYTPLVKRGSLLPLIASIGVLIAAQEAFRLVFGPFARSFPASVGIPSVHVGGAVISGVELVILVLAGLVLVGTWFVLRRTGLGLLWRATSQDNETAAAMGVNTKAVVRTIFIIGYGLAAVAGVLLGIHYESVSPLMGAVPAYKMLAIIILGGLGSPLGTIAAALLVGLVETFVVTYFGYAIPRDAIAFVLLIVVLLARPQGLLPGEAIAR